MDAIFNLFADAARYRWLRREQDRITVLASVVWKEGNSRASDEWINISCAYRMDELIDRAIKKDKEF